jgi:hypothetical protein
MRTISLIIALLMASIVTIFAQENQPVSTNPAPQPATTVEDLVTV